MITYLAITSHPVPPRAAGLNVTQALGSWMQDLQSFTRPPLQTTLGPYGLPSSASSNQAYHQASPQTYVSQQNFAPFTLPPPTFPTAVTTAPTTRDMEPSYPTSMSTDYPGESIHHQQSWTRYDAPRPDECTKHDACVRW